MTQALAITFALVALLAPAFAFPHGGRGLVLGWLVSILAVVLVESGRRQPRSSAPARIGPLLYVVAVVLIRHAAGGATSGFSPLLLLPLFWIALTEDRVELVLLCVAIAGALIGPILVVGEPAYPVGEWRRAALWLLIAPTVGLATQQLVTSARLANESLEKLVRTDPLTALLNRRGFADLAERELLRARRTGEPVVVAMIDLDHFKRFNDSFGHPAGDRLLAGAAAAWSGEVRDIDVLARWGGEEFIALLPRCPEALAHNVLDRVRVATPEGQTCSIGFSSWRVDEPLAEVTARADAALYAAKEAGRNRVMAGTAG